MDNLARLQTERPLPDLAHGLGAGTVSSVEAGVVGVRVGRFEVTASPALSCLVVPEIGDRVLVSIAPNGPSFILAVLERERHPGSGRRAVELRVDGDLTVAARGGTCRVEGTEAVEIHSPALVSVSTERFDLRAAEGNVVLAKLTLLATTVLAHSESARIAVKGLDTFCERVSQTMKRCHRKVEELDQLRADRVDYRAEQEITLRAKNLLASARALVKLDGEQIHIG